MFGKSKDDVSGNVARLLVRKIDGGIYLKKIVWSPGYPKREKVFFAALKINLNTILAIKVVCVSQDGLDPIMNGLNPGDQLMMFGVVTAFQKRLRPFAVRRPVQEADAKQVRILLDEAQFGAEDRLFRLNSLEHSDFEELG